LFVRPLIKRWGLLFATLTIPLMKPKNIIYKIIIQELKKFQGESFKKKSTLVNFTSAIKSKIEKKIGEYYESIQTASKSQINTGKKPRQQHPPDTDSKKSD
tara:strand:+ start:785 stop:1087 length:303 start_codon:yes stop_codon:yes gene_type:complete